MNSRIPVVVALAAMALCDPGPALGQTAGGGSGSNRPFRGLFGPGPQSPSGNTLDLMVSGYGAYQDNGPRVNNSAQGSSEPLKGGAFGGVTANLAFSHPGDRTSFSVTGNTALSYQPGVERPLTTSYGVTAGTGLTLGSRTSLSLSQAVQFAPYYRSVFGVVIDPSNIDPSTTSPADYAVLRADSWMYVTRVGLARRLGRRSSIDFDYNLRVVDFRSDDFSLTDQHIGAHVRRELSQRVALRAGYMYRSGVSDMTLRDSAPSPDPVGLHNIDVGVDYSRPLSLSRRTTLNFSTGSALVNRAREIPASSQLDSSLQFRVIGSVGLQHEIGRSWTARVAYSRDVGFVEGFIDPMLSDSVTAGISGLLTRDLNLLASVTYSHATPANASESNRRHEALAGSARLQRALARNLALYGQYIYYQTNVASGVALPDGPLTEFDRHVVRGGLTVWMPLIR
jgi:hypothetical protein